MDLKSSPLCVVRKKRKTTKFCLIYYILYTFTLIIGQICIEKFKTFEKGVLKFTISNIIAYIYNKETV